MINLNRYFAIKEMWEDRHSKVVEDLRGVWKQYREAMNIKSYNEMFPDSVKEITRHDGHYHIRGVNYSRGCTDGASCKIPCSLIDAQDRDAWFHNLHTSLAKERAAAQQREAAKQEQAERALLASLQAKYKEEN